MPESMNIGQEKGPLKRGDSGPDLMEEIWSDHWESDTTTILPLAAPPLTLDI